MDKIFSRSNTSELQAAREEIELLQQRITLINDVAKTLAKQLEEEKQRHTQLEEKTRIWKDKMKRITEQNLAQIQNLTAELQVYKQVRTTCSDAMTPAMHEAIQAALQSVITKQNNTEATENDANQVKRLAASPCPPLKKPEQNNSVEALMDSLTHSDKIADEAKQQPTSQLLDRDAQLALMQQKLKLWKERVVRQKQEDDKTISALKAQLRKELQAASAHSTDREAELTQKLSEREQECTQLRKELQAASAHSTDREAELTQKLSEREQECTQLRKELQAASAHSTDREAELTQKLSEREQECTQLREELQAASAHSTDREAELTQKLSEREQECTQLREELHRSQESLQALQSSVLAWKEKVTVAKKVDAERIISLESRVAETGNQLEQSEKRFEVLYGIVASHHTESHVVEYDFRGDSHGCRLVSVLLDLATSVRQCASVLCLSDKLTVMESIHEVYSALQHRMRDHSELTQTLSEVQQRYEELTRRQLTLQERYNDVCNELEQVKKNSVPDDVYKDVMANNRQLEERCELLRKEVKRQRDAFQQRDRERLSVHGSDAATCEAVGLGTSRGEDDLITHSTSDTNVVTSNNAKDDVGEFSAVLRAAAGGIFEKDMLSLAATQSQRDVQLRMMHDKIQHLEHDKAEMQKQLEHSNTVITTYTKELENFKSKERVQASMTYIRNIIHQYLCANDELRPKMIPAIATVLEFSVKEKQDVCQANPRCPAFR